ncbi:MFS transporter [Azorhizobium doebereinerae]|uniref:MFS transporter n=1 Tax=Azorhizobium doebereinerae TaxID=281091 RepID=UPI00040C6C17|nr:MFS transporter [Azorhizobium doebereinerae]
MRTQTGEARPAAGAADIHQAGALRADFHRVQDYIDETPIWADGTTVPAAPMTAMQWRIWGLAAAGKFFEGLVVFITGVALPLMGAEFAMTPLQHGLVSAASLFGILVGALLLGGLADQFGRKPMFVFEMALFILFLALLAAAPSFPWMLVFLFGVGLALGCDYPTAHLVISESIPSSARGRLVLAAFSFQALGALTGTAVGYLVLVFDPALGAWRLMYGLAIVPALLVLAGRFFITESSHWLLAKGRVTEAETTLRRLLERHPRYPKHVRLKGLHEPGIGRPESHIGVLFRRKTLRATLLASVPWFLQDLGTYGIGIFTPTILTVALGADITAQVHGVAGLVAGDMRAAEGAAFIDLLLVAGMVAAVLLADKVGRIPLQVFGFIGCAAGLLLASFYAHFTGPAQTVLIYAGFMLFNFMCNLGPNAQTYLLAGEVFPTHIRGLGAGFAAAFGKVGAVLTAFLFPILLSGLGTPALLSMLVATSLLGAFLTWQLRIETKGRRLDDIEL